MLHQIAERLLFELPVLPLLRLMLSKSDYRAALHHGGFFAVGVCLSIQSVMVNARRPETTTCAPSPMSVIADSGGISRTSQGGIGASDPSMVMNRSVPISRMIQLKSVPYI